MSDSHLIAAVYNDFTGLTRARTFPSRDLGKRLETGLGWVPANMCLTPFGPIAGANPFGPLGDLRMMPDPESEVSVSLGENVGDMHLFFSDLHGADGAIWDCCVRGFLKRSVEELASEFGLRLAVAFEHEFVLEGPDWSRVPMGFTLSSARRAERFLSQLSEALIDAGVAVEMLIPEYGARQFEVTCNPRPALLAADQAVLVREFTREVARLQESHASFSPKPSLDGPGNGVHVHFSLETCDGETVTTVDDGETPSVDSRTGAFVAGVQAALPGMTAALAPTAVSYLRLAPQQWSAGYTAFGYRNREAALRLCPGSAYQEAEGRAAANVELRIPDAGASPHLSVALLIQAGMAGLRESSATPTLMREDPSSVSEAERRKAGLQSLPRSLPEALSRLETDSLSQPLMPEPMRDAFLALKRAELEMVRGCSDSELCERYAQVY